MSTSSFPPHEGNTYFIDPEHASEMGRLIGQDSLLTKQMGPFFQIPQSHLSNIHVVLDVACGPGGWVLDLARTYPSLKVVGIDISERMIADAQAQAQAEGIPNAQFRVMNVLTALDFPDDTFDLVNTRFLVGFMPKDAWYSLVREFARITRPGGILQSTEGDTSSVVEGAAIIQLNGLITQALWRSGKSFTREGVSFGITPMLRTFLENGGYMNIGQSAYALDYSHGAEMHEGITRDFLSSFQRLLPFLTKNGLTTPKKFELLYLQAQQEMRLESFRAIWYSLTVWGFLPSSLSTSSDIQAKGGAAKAKCRLCRHESICEGGSTAKRAA